jgi:uncharacterized protein with FMN-binding domain
MKRTLWIALSVVGLLASMIGGIVAYSVVELRRTEISGIDLTALPDGVYAGEHGYMGFTCRVKVKVSGHRITAVEVDEGRKDEYVSKAEGVVDKLIKAQSLGVDTVTGATFSSRAILKATENALKRGER